MLAMGNRRLGFLIVTLFVGVLAAKVLCTVFTLVFESLGLEDNVVQKVLVDPLIQYEFIPMPLNLIVMTLTFGFSLNFNVLSLLGIGTAWYYAKYDY